MHEIKYRTWFKGEPPRRIKLQVPGWAGEPHHNTAQPWHCQPFRDGSTYGLELIYPFDTEAHVCTKEDKLYFEGDFSKEKLAGQNWEKPFSSFAEGHFGFTSSLDLKTEEGFSIMLLPHPRYYTDRTGTVPLPVAGLIESDYWPRVFFIVFKSPLEGQKYVFRKGEPYAQIIIVPRQVNYSIQEMTEEEKKSREKQENILHKYASKVATNTWKTITNDTFDNKYKCLSNLARKEGVQSVKDHLENMEMTEEQNKKIKEEKARRKMPRKIIL